MNQIGKYLQADRIVTRYIGVLAVFVSVILSGSCTKQVADTGLDNGVSHCQVIYDAGSSGTRLYVYQQTAAGWIKHRGPSTGALADPVRGLHGKTMADADTVVDDIAGSLEKMRRGGPENRNGKPEWHAFDWRSRCTIDAAAVYATAGMRLAEQEDDAASELIWKKLNERLSVVLGAAVTTRAITGYEEGLYAWLAMRESQQDEQFGVVEMGGASVQITFPCADCVNTGRVRVKDGTVYIFSHSFLGWGQDEAWIKFAPLPACARGAGKNNPAWSMAACSAGMDLSSVAADEIKTTVRAMDKLRWYRLGAFGYMKENDVERFCRDGVDSGFEPETSCFRAVYLLDVLDALGVPHGAEKGQLDWTLGAVICTATRCRDLH